MTWAWDYEETPHPYYHIYSDRDAITFDGARSNEADEIADRIVSALNEMEKAVS